MIESILVKKNVSLKAKITIKSLISAGVVAFAVLLPQLVHIWAGSAGGVQWLPMYLPVLLGACLLGVWWGLGVGIVSPVVSFLITFAMGNPMPAAARLPFMIAELAMIAAIAGLFSRKISQNGWMAFPAVLLAFVGGRIFFSCSPRSSKISRPLRRQPYGRRSRRGFSDSLCRRFWCRF